MKSFLFAFVLLCSINLSLRSQDYIQYKLNLNAIQEDQLEVEIKVPKKLLKKSMVFLMSKYVPYRQHIQDNGVYVDMLEAFDKKGNSLEVERMNTGAWLIQNAHKMELLRYKIQDSWEQEMQLIEHGETGSYFDAQNVFLLSPYKAFGYFEGYEKEPLEIHIHHPNQMQSSSPYKKSRESDIDTDVFLIANYNDFALSPIYYVHQLDTASFKVGYGDINIATNQKGLAQKIKEVVQPLLEQKIGYVGGILPTDSYSFHIFTNPNLSDPIYIPYDKVGFYAVDVEQVIDLIKKYTLEGFFGTINRSYLKPEEIYDFDYQNPQRSELQWMFDGVAPYSTLHSDLCDGEVNLEKFCEHMSDLYTIASDESVDFESFASFESMYFEASAAQMKKRNARAILALVAFDLTLLRLNEGKYDFQMFLRDLSAHFGRGTPFNKDNLVAAVYEILKTDIFGELIKKYTYEPELADVAGELEFLGVTFDGERFVLSEDISEEQARKQQQWLRKLLKQKN